MKVDVYLNLRKKIFSVRSREKGNYGRVIDHRNLVSIKNATFIVNKNGRERVLREKQKNIHAFIRGEMDDLTQDELKKIIPIFLTLDTKHTVTYNPYIHESFVDRLTGESVYKADTVIAFIDKIGAEILTFDSF